MNYQSKGLQFSLLVHAVVFAFGIVTSSFSVPVSKPIVIDFNIEDPKDMTKISTYQTERESKSQRSEVSEYKPEVERPEEKTVTQEETHTITPPTNPISESQVPVAAPVGAKTKEAEAKNEGQNIIAHNNGAGSSEGRDAIGSGSQGLIEKAKMRYLKEHFSYIRDMIMKNLSYPMIARKMGWEGKVMVSFIVYEDGRVEKIRIVESSGFEMLDENAVETIKKVSPFPKPPAKAELIMPILYRLE